MPVYSYDPPDRFVAGTVGQPGERTFYLQASSHGRVTSVALEKFQVSLLAERIDELLDEVLRRTGGSSDVPAAAPAPGHPGPGTVNGASSIPAGAAAASGQQSADTQG